MDEASLKKSLGPLVPFAEEYQVQWKNLQELDRERQLLDVEEYGITSTCHIREKILVLDESGKAAEKEIACRTVRKKHYGEEVPTDVPGDPLRKALTGEEKMVVLAHSSFLSQPKGPHELKRILEVYQ